MWSLLFVVALLFCQHPTANGFTAVRTCSSTALAQRSRDNRSPHPSSTMVISRLMRRENQETRFDPSKPTSGIFRLSNGFSFHSRYSRDAPFLSLLKRFDTLESAGLDSALTSGISKRIKSIHDPKVYLGLAGLAALRSTSLFRNYYYWILVAFLYKWYRARYVYKVPVWDRQPNWNNVITSKEQEKDLKAYTCKNCGSTIFIAKSREFFFEGGTGIGGLGCFACGAKGADNFVMDRDRIVEDVADVDDYFEYERPLDFVSSAERKRYLKQAGGDEAKANEILLEQSAATDTSQSGIVSAETIVTTGEETKQKSSDIDVAEEEAKPKTERTVTDESSKNKNGFAEDLDALGMDDL